MDRPQLSEDRREQIRAIRLVGAIALFVLVSGIGLWFSIRTTEDSHSERTINDSAQVSTAHPPKPIDPPQPTESNPVPVSVMFPPGANGQEFMENCLGQVTRQFGVPLEGAMDGCKCALRNFEQLGSPENQDECFSKYRAPSSEPAQAAIQSNDLTEVQAAKCLETVGQHYATRLAIPTCQCIMLVYKKTGSSERAANAMIPCVSAAMQALTNPGQTVTIPNSVLSGSDQ